MQKWIFENPITFLLLIGFLGVLCYALWLRYKSSVSKARFALAVVAALVSCSVALLTFMSGPVPWQLLDGALVLFGFEALRISVEGPGWLATLLAFLTTVAALASIYRFGVKALRSWEGPITVSVSELAKQNQDDSIALLALAEAKRLVRSQPDPPASDAAINWQQKQSDAPSSPAWHLLARSLFESAFREASFDDSGWRDRFQAWVGTMYVSEKSSHTSPLGGVDGFVRASF